MPLAERRAHVVWRGNLPQGSGQVSVGSGVLQDQPVTWASRTERPDGKTSPEELIAAAHASCFAMALSNTLATQGNTPEELAIDATTTFEVSESGPKVKSSNLHIRARVPGMEQAAFEQALQAAHQGCPVSNALRNNVEMNVTGELA